jgi:FAD/FMN-containing dehydrogenase
VPLNIRTADGLDIGLDESVIDRLTAAVQGDVLTPQSAAFADASTIWNAMIDRRPGLIIRCTSTDDVVKAVRFASEHRLLVSVRGGGHNIGGSALSDGGVLIDLSLMKGVRVDPDARAVRVGPGATLADVDAATQAYGLATPVGVNSTTGIAGLTLGGGFGWLSRRLGLTIDNLLSAEVVTATGDVVTASESQNADLFFGLRGGGGNFGIVTSFEFRLHQVGPEVLSGLVVHPLDAAPDVLRFYREFLAEASDDVACWFVVRKAPPLPFLAPEWHGQEVLVLAMCYAGSIEEGQRALQPIRAFGKPLADIVAPHPFAAWQQILDPLLTPGMRNYWKSHDVMDLSDDLIDVLLRAARQIPDPNSEIIFAQMGGAISRVPSEATAYTHREAQFILNIHGRWGDPAKDDECVAWARRLFDEAAPFATGGVYVNFMTQEEGERVRAAYGTNFDRLVELKNKYDPSNMFRINQNIRPSKYVMPGIPSPAVSSERIRG